MDTPRALHHPLSLYIPRTPLNNLLSPSSTPLTPSSPATSGSARPLVTPRQLIGRSTVDGLHCNEINIECNDNDNDRKQVPAAPCAPPTPMARAATAAARASRFWTARVIITLVFIAMVWATSLQLATWIAAAYVHTVTLDTVVAYWRTALTVTSLASDSYTACIKQQHALCNQQYNSTLVSLVAQQQSVMDHDQNVTTQSLTEDSDCTTTSLLLINTVQLWVDAGAVIYYNSDQCSASEISQTRSLIGDTITSSDDVATSTNSFLTQSQSLIDSAVTSVKNRTAYDAHYLASKLSLLSVSVSAISALTIPFPSLSLSLSLAPFTDLVNDFSVCVSGNGVSNSLCSLSLADSFQPVLDDLTIALVSTQSQMQLLMTEANQYSSTIVALLQQCQAVFSVLHSINDVLSELNINLNIPILPSPLPSFSFTGDFSVANAIHSVERASDAFAQLLDPVKQAALASVNNVKSDVIDTASQLVSDIQSVTVPLPALFEDFNPPAVDLQMTALSVTFSQYSGNILNETKTSIDRLESHLYQARNDTVSAYQDSRFALNSSSLPSINTSGLTVVRLKSLTDFSYASFSGTIDIPGFIDSLAGFFVAFLILDWAYRGYKTVNIVLSQIRTPAAYLEPIDARTYPKSVSKPLVHWTGYLVTHPTILYMLIVVIIGMSAYPIALVYSVFYKSYVSGCVESRNGTLLSINSEVVLYNLASVDGHATDLALTATYDATSQLDCLHYTSIGVDSYVKFLAQIEASRAQSNRSRQRIDLLGRCINMGASFNLSLYSSISAMPSILPQGLLVGSVQTQCKPKNTSTNLMYPSLNCSTLSSCSTVSTKTGSCSSGPDTTSIHAASFNSACQTEYYLHSSLFLYALVLLTYGCMNVSRSFITMGIVRWFWRWLSPNGLSFLGEVSETGLMARSSAVTLRQKAREAVKKHEKLAIVYFVLGLVSHAPYFLVIFIVGYTQTGIPPPQTA